ncbi:MAG: hypothetical protein A2Z36_02500 [Chloroflexi bacterium RBG_19FT_COMBO_48_23]|nr:MAG: hypothetical protein A2Z36_02500 [Chloroflexi bacterium RBG_19FT_COMBO_48_23]
MATVELNVITSGNIPWGLKRDIENIFRDCYRRFGSRIPYKVEIHVVDKEPNMRALLKEDKIRLGITTGGDEQFICSHDAWRGYPRVICCVEKLAKLNKLARPGAIRHEAAHSALHGSLEYYIFRIPDDCRHTAEIKALDSAVLDQALYYVSVAVKDFEATRFLIQHDFISCQFAFALDLLQLSEQDKSAWKLAQTSRQAKFIYLTTLLKPTLFAHPLLALPRSSKGISLEYQVQLARRVEELLEPLGSAEQNKLLQVANMIVEDATDDTHKNVDSAMRHAMNLA